jgi:hypothetical protein
MNWSRDVVAFEVMFKAEAIRLNAFPHVLQQLHIVIQKPKPRTIRYDDEL